MFLFQSTLQSQLSRSSPIINAFIGGCSIADCGVGIKTNAASSLKLPKFKFIGEIVLLIEAASAAAAFAGFRAPAVDVELVHDPAPLVHHSQRKEGRHGTDRNAAVQKGEKPATTEAANSYSEAAAVVFFVF